MKAIEKDETAVTCDHCDFEKKVDHIEKFHNKTCPICKHPDILITDNDLEAYKLMTAIVDTANDIFDGDIEEGKERVRVSVEVTDGKLVELKTEEI